MSATVISKPRIQELLFNEGVDTSVAAVELPDEQYALPAADWIANEFAAAFTSERNRWVGLYRNGCSDCDDFAEFAVTFAKFLFRNTEDRPKDAALAFGEFWYVTPQGGHAINLAICREGDELKLVFFEPQSSSVVRLTRKEIESCCFVRM